MARNCSICSRPDAGAVGELLRSGRSVRSVALEFGLSDDALGRHARHHVSRPAAPASSHPRAAAPAGDPLDELVQALRVRALAGSPADTREYRLALAAQSDARHSAPPQRDLATEPEWLALRTAMLAALDGFPEARQALADALGDA
jgi:transposase-like protein